VYPATQAVGALRTTVGKLTVKGLIPVGRSITASPWAVEEGSPSIGSRNNHLELVGSGHVAVFGGAAATTNAFGMSGDEGSPAAIRGQGATLFG